jgi:hypothetical protein
MASFSKGCHPIEKDAIPLKRMPSLENNHLMNKT